MTVARPTAPLCMDARELREWRDAALSVGSGGGHNATHPCIDCTAEYAGEMRDIGLCDGKPGEEQRDSDEPRER